MFTGLIMDVGSVERVTPTGASVHLGLRTRLFGELSLGDSLAVNGVCLTVTEVDAGAERVVATAIPETLSRTNLGGLRPGSRVNLEPALRLGDRMGGHWVQGHVDGPGRVTRVERRGLSVELTVEADEGLLRYVVEKGSITLDGVSLTVARVGARELTVALIPHTLGETTLQDRRVGDLINLETDILAKYIEKIIGGGNGVSEELLRRHGFI